MMDVFIRVHGSKLWGATFRLKGGAGLQGSQGGGGSTGVTGVPKEVQIEVLLNRIWVSGG